MPDSIFTKSIPELQRWAARERLDHRKLNKPVEAINTMVRGVGGPHQPPMAARSAAGIGVVELCIVRDVGPNPEGRTITIALVSKAAEQPFAIEPDGVLANTWPPLRARHYRAFLWFGGTIEDETDVLPAMQIGGEWWVMQQMTWGNLDLQSSIPISDCQV